MQTQRSHFFAARFQQEARKREKQSRMALRPGKHACQRFARAQHGSPKARGLEWKSARKLNAKRLPARRKN